ncbi:hypothetical protein D623_10004641 [Myotis brandtii]|uniref:Uncharacterized protein n=1 Tax=Myotis brandtii TaxID=109478 RepID=S7N6J6_MYOBR|nr:hypothetical protein D623_10004641 [Myotis brandtii]
MFCCADDPVQAWATPGSREGGVDETTFIGSVSETGSMKGVWVCELTESDRFLSLNLSHRKINDEKGSSCREGEKVLKHASYPSCAPSDGWNAHEHQ